MTDTSEDRVTHSNNHKTTWHDDAKEFYGTDKDFERTYDSTNDQWIIEHVSSGDQFRTDGSTLGLPVLTSAPSSPATGDIALQDGTSWNPTASGAQELVTYNGTSWVSA